MTTKRQAFKAIDANRKDPQPLIGVSKSKGVEATLFKSPGTSCVKSAIHKPTGILSSKTSAKVEPTQEECFNQVFKLRVAEDRTGDLTQYDVHPWTFGDFELVRQLGSGACAMVYAAKERQSGHAVALKIQDAEAGECYFDDEVDIHEPLDHPSIVNVVGYFYSDVPFIADEHESSSQYEDGDGFASGDESSTSKPCCRYLCMILELCDGQDLYDTMRATANKRLDEATALCTSNRHLIHWNTFTKKRSYIVTSSPVILWSMVIG